jgi:uncharacterized RDD family membrane protein YckC
VATGRTMATPARTFPAGAAERQGLRAGVVSRIGAMVVDAAVAAFLVGGIYLAWAALRFMRNAARFSWPTVGFLELLAVAAIVVVLSLTIQWSATGRSSGGRFMGLRVVGRDGEPIHVPRAFLRAIACVVFPLGLLWSALSRKNASVQDLLFATRVIYDWQARVPAATGGP